MMLTPERYLQLPVTNHKLHLTASLEYTGVPWCSRGYCAIQRVKCNMRGRGEQQRLQQSHGRTSNTSRTPPEANKCSGKVMSGWLATGSRATGRPVVFSGSKWSLEPVTNNTAWCWNMKWVSSRQDSMRDENSD